MTTPDDVQQLVIPRRAVTEMHTTLTEFADGNWDGLAVNQFADLRDQLGAWLEAPDATTPEPDQMCTCGHGAASAHDIQTQAPAHLGALAGREQRRRTTANILARIDRSKRILEDEATLLRTLVAAEQADADQSREQRDQAAASLTDLRNDLYAERRAHEQHRHQLAAALGCGPDTTWDELRNEATAAHFRRTRKAEAEAEQHRTALAAALYCPEDIQWGRLIRAAEQTAAGRRTWRDKAHEMEADAVQARRGEAEAVRAREAAERDRDAAWREAGAARIRSGRTLAEARRNRDAWRNARKRAADLATLYDVRTQEANGWHAQAEAARKTVRDYENRLSWETTCGEHARLLDSCRAAEERAERAEATLTAERLAQQRRVETTITAIRHAGLCADCEINLRAAIEAALGDPQPATEPDPCAHGCRQAADEHTRLSQEIDAEPECADPQGCHRVVPCNPGCAVTRQALADAMTKAQQPAEPLLRGNLPPLVISIDLSGAALADAIRRAARFGGGPR